MAVDQHHSWRPTHTKCLIQYLSDPGCSLGERRALTALSTRMIRIFENDPKSYTAEAAALSEITDPNAYCSLISGFANAIIRGTTDGDILDPDLLTNFAYAFRRAPTTLSAETAKLGSVLDSLHLRLSRASSRAELETQYHLVYIISTVLDVMVDIKFSGLNREAIHEPLLQQLKSLSNNPEPRLSQAASYTYEALRYVPDDEDHYQALLRYTGNIIQATANIAGAIPTMDPMRIVAAVPDAMKLLSLFKSLVDATRDIYTASQDIRNMFENIGNLSKGKEWYMALRYTKLLIEARAFRILQDFIEQQPYNYEKQFWCGLYAQLEHAWEIGDSTAKGQVTGLLDQFITQREWRSSHVKIWIRLIADTLDQARWKIFALERRHCLRRWKNKKGQSKLQHFNVRYLCMETLPTDLLNRAWSECKEAQRLYADFLVREYYRRGRLEIRRLSGDLLDMAQCYINLSVIQHTRENDKQTSSDREARHSAFTLFSRMNVHESSTDKSLTSPKLFEKRKCPDGTEGRPKRILIRGRAGVGKSTLCKKIIYDFLHNQLWAEYFDRILWIPLRSLKGTRSLNELLHDEYFALQGERDCLVSALHDAIFDPTDQRTLLLLDGLDEISGERHFSGIDLTEKFKDLLNQQNVIITSRPYAVSSPDLNLFDLELETIGFSPAQVQDYLTKVVKEQTAVEEIRAFIKSHWVIQGLVQIPIQLDALCYSWYKGLGSGNAPQTMTTLYQAIEIKLWNKDILQLGKENGQGPLNGSRSRELRTRSQVEDVMEAEIKLLEFLAFTGLVNDKIEFNQDIRDKLYGRPSLSGMSDDILDRVSFLRTSDPSADHDIRNYHFLHLTFQEFFAAQHFVRCWTTRTSLSYLDLSSADQKSEKQSSFRSFIQQEKYSVRYDIFWRFVVGLLHDEGEEELWHFLELIESEPRDLLGPAHQRLLMHCFNEVPHSKSKSRLENHRVHMEHQCRLWSAYEYKLHREMHICREAEFPEQILNEMLTNEPDNVKTAILQSLLSRPHLSSNLLELTASFLRGDYINSDVGRAAIEVLCRQSSLSDNILQALVSQLDHGDTVIRQAAIEALGRHSSLSDNVLQTLISKLDHGDFLVKQAAVEALGRQSSLSDNVLQALVSQLYHDDFDVRQAAIEALGQQSSLPNYILKALVSQLNHGDFFVRRAAIEVLGRQSSLSDNVLQVLVSQLDHGNTFVIKATINTLGRQSSLSDNILQALVSRLNHGDTVIRQAAVEALGRHSSLSDNVLQTLISKLDHGDFLVKQAAVEALGRQSSLSDNVLQALVSQFDHDDSEVRQAAIEALGQQSSLPNNILQALASQLDHGDSRIRRAAIEVLGRQSSLSDNVLQALVSQLDHDDFDVRQAAIEALGQQSSLPNNILQDLVTRLDDDSEEGFQVERVLRKHGNFYSMFPHLHAQILFALYRIWVIRAFMEQFSCYMQGGVLYIDAPDMPTQIPLLPQNGDVFKKFLTAVTEIGNPSLSIHKYLEA